MKSFSCRRGILQGQVSLSCSLSHTHTHTHNIVSTEMTSRFHIFSSNSEFP
uniref:Uncharacterized protein n=1 Tax=Arion vulgaris TaxID=1028688 RepID=A0A0B7BHJ5_9EUPU